MRSNRKTLKKTCSPYSTEDYNSNDGMLTTVWGPSQWHFLHTMSFNYPVEPTKADKKHYLDYIYSLRYTLPCGKCRANLHKNLKKLPLKMSHMASRETFSRYVYDLHELINKMLDNKILINNEQFIKIIVIHHCDLNLIKKCIIKKNDG